MGLARTAATAPVGARACGGRTARSSNRGTPSRASGEEREMTSLRSRALLYASATTLLATITWLDRVTGYDFGFFVFYFLPVALVAWYATRRAALLVALAAGGCWYLADLSSHHPYLHWEALTNLLSLLTAALALSQIRADLVRREEFLDVVSHDLRAPLGALVGQAQVLRKKVGGDAFVAARVESILRCA